MERRGEVHLETLRPCGQSFPGSETQPGPCQESKFNDSWVFSCTNHTSAWFKGGIKKAEGGRQNKRPYETLTTKEAAFFFWIRNWTQVLVLARLTLCPRATDYTPSPGSSILSRVKSEYSHVHGSGWPRMDRLWSRSHEVTLLSLSQSLCKSVMVMWWKHPLTTVSSEHIRHYETRGWTWPVLTWGLDCITE